MDKFKLSQLVDYFIKTNSTGVSYKDLSKDDLTALAVLSIFDKGGKSVKVGDASYERPDGVIDEKELNISKDEYNKAISDIYKAIQKEKGKDLGAVKIPTYEQLQLMMANDKKIDFEEISLYTADGIIRTDDKRPEPVLIPQKSGDNRLTLAQMEEFLTSAVENHGDALDRIQNALDIAEKNNTTAFDFTGLTDDAQKAADEFVPDNDAAYNKQVGKDGHQYNEKGQLVTRINNNAGMYEKYKYDSNKKDAPYTEMMRYNGNGYKVEYWRRETLQDSNGNSFEGIVQYILDENEKVSKIILPPQARQNQQIQDFNDFMLYERVMRYDEELAKAEENQQS